MTVGNDSGLRPSDKGTGLQSCIYVGRVRHRRFQPIEHQFSYGLFMMYLDLGELPDLFRGRWLWSHRRAAAARFDRRDHLGDPDVPLEEAVRQLAQVRTGSRPQGPIRLLTHLRYFGYCFNPISLYFCFDASGKQVETIVAEVDNTPWGERHCYVLDEQENRGTRRNKLFEFPKQLHVSPFMDMAQRYRWRISAPEKALTVHIENWQGQQRLLDATLSLSRREATSLNLGRALAFYPFMTARVVSAIYWQAFRLWRKGAPFFAHPDESKRVWEAGK